MQALHERYWADYQVVAARAAARVLPRARSPGSGGDDDGDALGDGVAALQLHAGQGEGGAANGQEQLHVHTLGAAGSGDSHVSASPPQ